MRPISRAADVSINTVAKLLADAGEACAAFHDEKVRDVKAKRGQCDEIWAFRYAKQRNVATAKGAPDQAGDIWTRKTGLGRTAPAYGRLRLARCGTSTLDRWQWRERGHGGRDVLKQTARSHYLGQLEDRGAATTDDIGADPHLLSSIRPC